MPGMPKPSDLGERGRWQPIPLELPLEPSVSPRPEDADADGEERDRPGTHVVVIDLA
jgi:hypothetical protein